MANVIHTFCVEVSISIPPPDQWITNVMVPLPKKGDLSLMTNYRGGITLISIAAKIYNKVGRSCSTFYTELLNPLETTDFH